MTDPVAAPATPVAPTVTPEPAAPTAITHQPFSAKALARVLPKTKAGAAPAPAPETPAAPAAIAEPPALHEPSLLEKAQAASQRIVERRKAKVATETAAAARAAQLQADNARLAQEAATARAMVERIDKDPLGVMRERGITDKMVAQSHVDASTPEAKIAALEARIQADADARIARERQDEGRAAAQDTARREQHFSSHVQTVRESAEADAPLKWSYVAARARVAPALVVAEGRAAIALHQAAVQRETGVPPERQAPPTNEDVYDYLEWSYAQADAARLGAVKPPPAVPAPVEQAAPVAKPAKAPGTPGLSTKGTGPAMAPKSYGQMSPKERRAHDVAAFKKVGVGRIGKDADD